MLWWLWYFSDCVKLANIWWKWQGPLREVVETVQREVVEGELLRDCLELGSNDLKGLIQIFKEIALQYSSTPGNNELWESFLSFVSGIDNKWLICYSICSCIHITNEHINTNEAIILWQTHINSCINWSCSIFNYVLFCVSLLIDHMIYYRWSY